MMQAGSLSENVAEQIVRSRSRRGLRRVFSFVGTTTVRDVREAVFRAFGFVPGIERQAHVLAHDIDLLRKHRTACALTFRRHEGGLLAAALHYFSRRRVRRVQTIVFACLFAAVVAMGARDGNTNGRADVFDLADAAREIVLGGAP